MADERAGYDFAADDPRSFPALPDPKPYEPPAWLVAAQAESDRWQRRQVRGRRVANALLPLYAVAVLVMVYGIGFLPGPEAAACTGALFVIFGYQWFLPYITSRWDPYPSKRRTEPPSGD